MAIIKYFAQQAILLKGCQPTCHSFADQCGNCSPSPPPISSVESWILWLGQFYFFKKTLQTDVVSLICNADVMLIANCSLANSFRREEAVGELVSAWARASGDRSKRLLCPAAGGKARVLRRKRRWMCVTEYKCEKYLTGFFLSLLHPLLGEKGFEDSQLYTW